MISMVLFLVSGLDESVLEECLQYLEKQLESSQVRKAMEEFFSFRYCDLSIIPLQISLGNMLHIYIYFVYFPFVAENWCRS